MGIFDKILGRKAHPEEETVVEAPKITLDTNEMDEWASKLIAHFELKKKFKQFLEESQKTKDKLHDSLSPFKDEDVLSKIPERARTVSTLHGNEFVQQTEKLLEKAHFTDLYSFEEEHAEFLEAINEFRERTKKNASALEEFLGKQLKESHKLIIELEDRILNFMKVLEETKFHYIQQVHDAHQRLLDLEIQREKYQELLESLQIDMKRTEKKRAKIEEEIKKQRTLIRNEQAQDALEQLQELEVEFDKTINKFEVAAKDTLRYYQRYSEELELDSEVKNSLEGISSDATGWLESSPDKVTHAMRHAADQIDSEGRGNVQNLVSRLVDLANTAEQEGKKAKDILPKQRSLKKEIIRDVAALSIYDQQQFLIRANRETEAIKIKIEYLEEELSPKKRIVIEREIKDAAINIGAKITGSEPEEQEIQDAEELEQELEEKELEEAQEPKVREETPEEEKQEAVSTPESSDESEEPVLEDSKAEIETSEEPLEETPKDSEEDMEEDIEEAEEELKRNPPGVK